MQALSNSAGESIFSILSAAKRITPWTNVIFWSGLLFWMILFGRGCLTLDFVRVHPSLYCLETSADRPAFFTEKMGLPTKILPGETYAGIDFQGHQTLYFTDCQPSFWSQQVGPTPMPCVLFSCTATRTNGPSMPSKHTSNGTVTCSTRLVISVSFIPLRTQETTPRRGDVRQVHGVSGTARPLGIDPLFPGPMVLV